MDYFTAAIPEPVRIFGVRLLPLSLGRYRNLKRFGCGFVSEGEAQASMEDLLLGITTCSMRCAEFQEFVEDPAKLRPQLKQWGKRIRKEVKADPHFSILEKFGLFKHYIAEASQVPLFWDESGAQGGSGGHWSQNVEVVLRSELHYSKEEIEEGPLAKSLSDYFKYAENQGLLRIMSESEVREIATQTRAELTEFVSTAKNAESAEKLRKVLITMSDMDVVRATEQLVAFVKELAGKDAGAPSEEVPHGS